MPSPYRQMATHGDKLSSGTLLHTLPLGIPPHSLAKLIDRAAMPMSTLECTQQNHSLWWIIRKNAMQGFIVEVSMLSLLCEKLILFIL